MFSIAICVCDALGELIETAADKMLSSIEKTALRRDPEGNTAALDVSREGT
ncbi:hypothetical protein ACFSHR_16710 [Azotobacter chroococcum]